MTQKEYDNELLQAARVLAERLPALAGISHAEILEVSGGYEFSISFRDRGCPGEAAVALQRVMKKLMRQ